MPPSVFVCYRREDTAAYAGWLRQSLVDALGKQNVFMDIDTIAPGADFDDVIKTTLDRANVVLVLIGPKWSSVQDETGARRLDDPDDYVRLEVGSALERKIRVIPVLVGGARIPKSQQLPDDLKRLARRQAVDLSDTRWAYDTERLIVSIKEFTATEVPAPRPQDPPIIQASSAARASGSPVAAPTSPPPAAHSPHRYSEATAGETSRARFFTRTDWSRITAASVSWGLTAVVLVVNAEDLRRNYGRGQPNHFAMFAAEGVVPVLALLSAWLGYRATSSKRYAVALFVVPPVIVNLAVFCLFELYLPYAVRNALISGGSGLAITAVGLSVAAANWRVYPTQLTALCLVSLVVWASSSALLFAYVARTADQQGGFAVLSYLNGRSVSLLGEHAAQLKITLFVLGLLMGGSVQQALSVGRARYSNRQSAAK